MLRYIIVAIISFILGCWITDLLSTPTVKELERINRLNRCPIVFDANNKEDNLEIANTSIKPVERSKKIRQIEEPINEDKELIKENMRVPADDLNNEIEDDYKLEEINGLKLIDKIEIDE